MLNVLEECFSEQMKSETWKTKLSNMIPSYGASLITDVALCKKTRAYTTAVLKLEDHG